jgi:hypothetical protein
VVNGKITCIGSGCATASGWVACDPLVINAPPKAATTTNPVSSPRKAQFDNNNYTSYYYIGSTPKFSHNITAISNNQLAKCDSIRNEIKGPNINETAGYALAIQANEPIPVAAQSMTATSAFSSVAANTSVTARVIAKCRGNYDTLVTATATVVPNPKLSADVCKWKTSTNAYGGGNTMLLTDLSSPPELNGNGYGHCAANLMFLKDNAPWNGTLPAWQGEEETVGGIKLCADCSNNGSSLGYLCTNSCPNIVTKNPLAMCQYTKNLCNNMSVADVIPVTTLGKPNNDADYRGKCYFVTSINDMRASNVSINGYSITTSNWCTSASDCTTKINNAGISTIDGGYYVYIANNSGNSTQGFSLSGNGKLSSDCVTQLENTDCEAKSLLSSYCPPGTTWSTMKWNQTPSGVTSGCYYATSISMFFVNNFNQTLFKINGVKVTNQVNSNNIGNYTKTDGGYYIYYDNTSSSNSPNISITNGKPICADN